MALISTLDVPWHHLLEILLNCPEQGEKLFRRNTQKYGPSFKFSLLLGIQMYLVSDMKSRKSQYGRKNKLEYIESLSNKRTMKKLV